MADDVVGALTALVAVVTLPLGVLSLFFVGWEVSMAVFVVGWFLLTPAIPIVGKQLVPAVREAGDERTSEDGTTDPLDELKRRYAEGEVGDEEFERRVENLVETEDAEVAPDVEPDRGGERSDVDRLRE